MGDSSTIALVFIELGAATLVLAGLCRIADRLGFSAIPLYLLAGLAFGNGGLLPLPFSEDFVHVGAEIGLVLLLFSLGLEHTADELLTGMRKRLPAGVVDLLLNFTPGFALGLILGWPVGAAAALGGVTYVSSSGVAAKVIHDLGRTSSRETPSIVSILVIEDLAMAVYLPLLSIALHGGGTAAFTGAALAVFIVVTVFFGAHRFGKTVSRYLAHPSDEILVLTCFGSVLLAAGLAQRLQVSAAVGAFLVGIVLSGPVAHHARRVVGPVRDLFAAVFFFFFGLQVDPSQLVPALPLAAGLAVVTALTKLATGWWVVGRGLGVRERARIGTTLIARGEFSIVIAGFAVGAKGAAGLAPLAAAYVLLCAAAGPFAARFSDRLVDLAELLGRKRA